MSLVPITALTPTVVDQTLQVRALVPAVEQAEKELAEAEEQTAAALQSILVPAAAKALQALAEENAALKQRLAAFESQKKEMEVIQKAKDAAAKQLIEYLNR